MPHRRLRRTSRTLRKSTRATPELRGCFVTPAKRLTANVKAAGCAAKLSPKLLDRVLAKIPRWPDENVLVGFDTADDAGVYKLTAELAMVQTVDFFPPIVDDPYTYGAIAAVNALSDVY